MGHPSGGLVGRSHRREGRPWWAAPRAWWGAAVGRFGSNVGPSLEKHDAERRIWSREAGLDRQSSTLLALRLQRARLIGLS